MIAEQERLEDDLIALAERFDDPAGRVRAALWRFSTAVEHGWGAELDALQQTAAENAMLLSTGSYHYSVAYHWAALSLLRGRVGDAEVLIERAAAVGREAGLDEMIVEAVRVTQLLGVRHEQHRLRELREQASEFYAPGGVTVWPAVAFLDGEIGELDSVGENVDTMLDGFAAHGPTALNPIGVVALMAAPIARLEDPVRAARLREMILPISGQGLFFTFFAGPVDYHLGLLARTLSCEAEARQRFSDAVTFCERLGAPCWADRCRAALEADVPDTDEEDLLASRPRQSSGP